MAEIRVEGSDAIPNYDFSELWNGMLYNWLKAKESDREKVVGEIIKNCKARNKEIIAIMDGFFHSKNGEKDIVYIEPIYKYIKFSDIIFEISIPGRKIKCISRIRINPCLRDDPSNKRFSKIWCIIETSDKISSKDNIEFYKIAKNLSDKVIKLVGEIYIKEIEGHAEPIHNIIIKSFGSIDPHIKKLMLTPSQISEVPNILNDAYSRNILVDVIQNTISRNVGNDVIRILNSDELKDKQIFRLIQTDKLNGLFYIFLEESKTTLTTLFDTDDLITSHKLVREFVKDIVLQL